MNKIRLLVFCLAVLFMSGCDVVDNYIDKRIEAKIGTPNKEDLQQTLSNIDKRLYELDFYQKHLYSSYIEGLLNTAPSYSILNPNVKNLSVAGSNGFFFATSCNNFKKYGNGSSIELAVTNLSSVAVSVLMKIWYGDDLAPTELKERVEDIYPGMSKTIEIRTPEYPPEKLGNITIQYEVIGMRNRIK